MTRGCGGCNACCDVLEIAEFKPAEELCKHWRVGSGCSAYNTRPEGCRTFRCIWLDGFFEKRDRPDKGGFVVAMKATATPYVSALWPLGGGKLRAAAREMAQKHGVVFAATVFTDKDPAFDGFFGSILDEVPVFLKVRGQPVRTIMAKEWTPTFQSGKMVTLGRRLPMHRGP